LRFGDKTCHLSCSQNSQLLQNHHIFYAPLRLKIISVLKYYYITEVNILHCNMMIIKVKSKDVLRQTEVAQGVLGRLRPQIFLTFWHYKDGRSSAKRTGRLYPRRNPWYSLSEAKSTSGHMVVGGTTEKIPSDTTRNRSWDRLVAQRLNHYATPGP